MVAPRRSIKRVIQRESSLDKKIRQSQAHSQQALDQRAVDSFQNFAQGLGIGADSPLSGANYGFNPITRIRTELEFIHRGSWLGGVAVDVVADDMTRGGVEFTGEIEPDDMELLEETATTFGVWEAINETTKWARLYGGAIAVIMIDGQDFSTPMRVETIGKNAFQGLLVLDRWMVEPSLSDLVTKPGPSLGLPKFYTITADAPALPRLKVHYSRIMRMEGIKLPYYQRMQENMWGLSVLERLFDRMVAFDSASTGAAQLCFKAFLRTYKIDGLRENIAAGGPALNGLMQFVQMMRRTQSNEGITLIDGKDDFTVSQSTAMTGIGDVLTQLGQQISGALQIPLARLFGQSPSGFSTGDTDMKMYYDTIKQQQMRGYKVPVTLIYRCMAQSLGIKLPTGFGLKFRSLWEMTAKEKSEIAGNVTTAVVNAYESGLIGAKTAMQELRQSSEETGIYSNITDEAIDKADEDPPAPEGADPESAMENEGGRPVEPKSPTKQDPQEQGEENVAA